MSCKFRVGDKVRRVEGSHVLKVGSVYKVTRVNADGWIGLEDYSYYGEFNPNFFSLAEPAPKKRPNYDLIIAWASGAEIEIWSKGYSTWISCPNPAFLPDMEYRIKPKSNPELEKLNKLIEDMDKQLSDAKKRLKEMTND
tara:strand:- start:4232 stop:4651 length:420 start_codon:yes stop_codon:yes gene_type:complete